MILWKMNKEDSCLSFRLVRCPKAEIFAEMFRAILQSLVYGAAMLVYLCGTPIWRPENSVTSGTYFGYLGH